MRVVKRRGGVVVGLVGLVAVLLAGMMAGLVAGPGLAGWQGGADPWRLEVRRAEVGAPTLLTEAGCCPGSRMLSDGSLIVYRRTSAEEAGAWRITPDGRATRVWPRFGHVSADGQVITSAAGDQTLVERLDGSLSLTLANGGVEALPAPDGRTVAYLARVRAGGRTADAREQVTVARLDGGPPRVLLDLARSDWLRWFPDGRHLVVFGWRPEGVEPGLWVINVDRGTSQQIVAANFLTAVEVAPDGQWIAYLATLQPRAEENGLWLVRPDGSDRRRVPHERAARWSADGQALLAVMPAPGGKEIHRYELASGLWTVPVGRADADFDVEGDDWLVAPDGRSIVYRSARDRGLWRLGLGG